MSEKYDIVVIGAGPGGIAAAVKAARSGANVALIEKDTIGGVCLNWGCIPTKALLYSASLFAKMKHAEDFGIKCEKVSFSFKKIADRKNHVVENLKKGLLVQVKNNKISLLKGNAQFIDKTTVRIGDTIISADKIIIASGSSPVALPNIPFDGKQIVSSKDALTWTMLPESLAIIGGGVIGCEFAYLFSALGVNVTVIEAAQNLLPREDKEIGKRLNLFFKKAGIACYSGTKVLNMAKDNKQVALTLDNGQQITSEKVLIAVGRSANIHNLNLDVLNLEINNGFINTNEFLETNIKGIYAIGDCINTQQLAHAAHHEGIAAALNAVKGNVKKIKNHCMPSCIFTVPEIASVGLTIDEALEKNIAAETSKVLYGINGKAHCAAQTDGFVKLVFEKTTQQILGAQIMGAGASDLIAEVALAVQNKLSLSEIAETIHAHPTHAELISEAATEGVFKMNG